MGMSGGENGINHQDMTSGLVPDSGNLHTPMYGFNQKWKYDPKEESIGKHTHGSSLLHTKAKSFKAAQWFLRLVLGESLDAERSM